METHNKNHFIAFLVVSLAMIPGIYGGDCNCHCRNFRPQHICESMENLQIIADANTQQLLKWERYRPFVERFSDRWEKEIAAIVEMKLDEFIAAGKIFPKPENLVSETGNEIQNDSPVVPKSIEDDADVVSNLLVKVERVENRTMEVEEELKSERRVRRDLEKEVEETRSSLISLGDQLQNATVPVDAVMNQVQMVVVSSLEDMNKTYAEYLKRLYYKVEGVVYQNETKKLDERLELVETELQASNNSSVVFKLAEDLKALEGNLHLLNNSIEDTLVSRMENINISIGDVLIPRILTLESETVRKNVAEELEARMMNLLNNTELFKTALVDVWSDIQDIRNFDTKFQSFSAQWSASLRELQSQVEILRNESLVNRLGELEDETQNEILESVFENTFQDNTTGYEGAEIWDIPLDVETTHFEGYSTEMPDITTNLVNWSMTVDDAREPGTTVFQDIASGDRGRIEGEIPCEKPDIQDANLLADVVTDSPGRNHLKFGCRPIGLYKVSHLPALPRCAEGSWKGTFPSCIKLPTVSEIEAMDLRGTDLCSGGSGEIPDPTNCSQFFKCSHGKMSVLACPPGLHFNPHLKVCDYPRTAACVLVKNIHEEKLRTLIPLILIEPDNLDKPSSHLGTGSTGQLIVHPRSSFTLHCVYPKNNWGYPKWNVTHTNSQSNPRYLVLAEGSNMVSLTVTVAIEGDSGVYNCITPFGVQHAIEVTVKVVVCPAFAMEEEHEDVFYRPTPEGELRIMGTRAEFHCEEGHKIFAQCMANGTWSESLPLNKECTLKKRTGDSTWNCKSFDVSQQPDLILERNNFEKIITFKCAGGKRLIGNSFTRCRSDGLWSHVSLPRCRT